MTIAEFIRESVLRPRLKQAGALVVWYTTLISATANSVSI